MAGFTPLFFRPAHVGLLAAAVLSGCALNNPPPVDMGSTAPVTAVAIAPPAQAVSNSGSLYQASRYRPVFENRRARMVGDTVMVQIVEKVAASQMQSSNVSRSNELDANVGAIPFLNSPKTLGRLSAEVESSNKFQGGGGTSSANTFSGTITTSVIEVLPNGHLVVAGEKQIGVNQNVDVLRFTGTIDPYQLAPNSVISSTQVANVRVESRGRGQQNTAQAIGWLSRFFLSFIPF